MAETLEENTSILQRCINSRIPIYYRLPKHRYLWFGIDTNLESYKKKKNDIDLLYLLEHPFNYNLSKIISNNEIIFFVELNMKISDIDLIKDLEQLKINGVSTVFTFDGCVVEKNDAIFHIEKLINDNLNSSSILIKEKWNRIKNSCLGLKFFGDYYISEQGSEIYSKKHESSLISVDMNDFYILKEHEDDLKYHFISSSIPSVEDINEISIYKVPECYRHNDYKLLCDLAAFAHFIFEKNPSLPLNNSTIRAEYIDEFLLKKMAKLLVEKQRLLNGLLIRILK